MELPRQQHDGEQRQHRHREKAGQRRHAGEHRRGIGLVERAGEQRQRAVKHHEGHEDADGEKGHQLDDQFGGDRQHQPVLMLGGVGVAGAEQHRERRHQQRDEQRAVADDGLRAARIGLRQDSADRRRHRFELQRDIGDHADDGDQRHRRRHRLALAVARGDQVGDRGDVLALGEPHDADQQRVSQPDHHHRADIDGEEIQAAARGKADGTEERPRRAIDRQRQRIDQQSRRGAARQLAPAVAVARHQEQKADIGKGNDNDDPALQHGLTPNATLAKRLRAAFLGPPRPILMKVITFPMPCPWLPVIASEAKQSSPAAPSWIASSLRCSQ